MARGLVLIAALILLLAPASAQQKTVFRSGVQTVVLHATVRRDDGRLVPDLEQDAFEVRDEGRKVDITVFSNDPQPITVALLLDMSGSMVRHFLRVRESTKHFIDALHKDDRVRIGTFGVEVALNPWLTDDKAILRRIVNEELWPGGGTPLWEAVHAAMDSLEHESGRRVILTLSDGVDAGEIPGMEGSSGRARERAEGEGFMVYAIGVEGAPLDHGITALAERTGGGYFKLEAGADLSATFVRVVEELRHQYVLGFTPPKADGKMHEVDVGITRAGMNVRARRNYRAPGRQ
jgi:Ca-activated chloride channel homolog